MAKKKKLTEDREELLHPGTCSRLRFLGGKRGTIKLFELCDEGDKRRPGHLLGIGHAGEPYLRPSAANSAR